MTKEEILNANDIYAGDYHLEETKKCMDIWAKQECIEFGSWALMNYNIMVNENGNRWYSKFELEDIPYTTEQIFDNYLKTKEQ